MCARLQQLEQMDLEVRGLSSQERQKYSTRLQSYKAELNKLERDLVSRNSHIRVM